jgi:hypothetical protein
MALPTRATMKHPRLSRYPKGFSPRELRDKTLAGLAEAFGRPQIWMPEPATGGAVIGIPDMSAVAVHLDTSARCDRVYTRTPNELEFSWRCRTIGVVKQRPINTVVQWLGAPTSQSSGAGYTLLQWQRPGYHLALRFDADGICEGVTHEYASEGLRGR